MSHADLQQAIANVLEVGAAVVRAERIGVWMYREEYAHLHCIATYRRSTNSHAFGEELRCHDLPSCAASRRADEVMAVTDALADPRAGDIPPTYFEENDIRSFLDAPVRLHGRLAGILRFEHVGEQRAWTPEDERLAANMATLVSLCFDASERRQAEQARRVSDNRFRALFVQSPIPILVYDKDDGRIIDANMAAVSAYGHASLDDLQRGGFWLEPPYSRDDFLKWIRMAAAEGPQQFEWYRRRVAGEVLCEQVRLCVVAVNGAERALATAIDMTERKRLEQRLADQLAFQQALMDTIPYPVFYKNAETRFMGCNRAYEDAFGIGRENFVGKRVLDLEYLPPDDRVNYQAEDEATIASVGSVSREMSIPLADGNVHQTLYTVNGFRQADGAPGGLIGVIVDISDLKRAEQALRESEEKYRTIFDNAPIGIFRTTFAGRFLEANTTLARMIGYDTPAELMRNMRDVGDDLYYEPLFKAKLRNALLASPSRATVEVEFKRRDGTRFHAAINASLQFDEQGRPAFLDGTIEDINERKQMLEMMVQTEKMMSVGGLAAGMAHEINNPLGGILQGMQNIQRRLDPGFAPNAAAAEEVGCSVEAVRAYLERRGILRFLEGIRESGSRAANIVSNMLEFSRRSESRWQRVALPALVDRALELAANAYDIKKGYDFRRIEVARDFAADLPEVYCMPTEIEQVLLNLFKNAAQAMSQRGERDAPPRLGVSVRHEGDMVCMEIADNGPGMEPDVRRRVFEPFFTTKKVGEGTGLGLSVSYFIITTNHNGVFNVDSEPGKGTVFTVRLPVG